MAALTTTACPYCSKPIDGSTPYCPHCFLRLPGVARAAPAPAATPSTPAPRGPRLAKSRDEERSRPVRKAATPRARTKAEPEAKPAGQCPACAHPITTRDEWCKWCHWPVNRKN